MSASADFPIGEVRLCRPRCQPSGAHPPESRGSRPAAAWFLEDTGSLLKETRFKHFVPGALLFRPETTICSGEWAISSNPIGPSTSRQFSVIWDGRPAVTGDTQIMLCGGDAGAIERGGGSVVTAYPATAGGLPRRSDS